MTSRLRRSLLATLVASSFAWTASPSPARADDLIAQCIAASDKALDLRKQGKLLEARRALATCASTSCGADISDTCQKRIVEINAALPTVVFAPKDAAGNDLVAVKLSVDGALYAEKLDGNPMVFDPGEHEFRFEVTGQLPLVKRLVLRQGEQNRREEVVIGPPAQASAAPATQAVAVPATSARQENAPPTASSPSSHADAGVAKGGGLGTLKMLGLAAGGAGVAGIVVGSVFGLMASSASSQQKSECPSATNCPNYSNALSDHSSMVTDATISDVGFVAGAALLATGAVLFFMGPSGASEQRPGRLAVTPHVGLGPAGRMSLGLGGEF